MELGCFPAESRDTDRVLEEPASVAVMTICARGRERAERGADPGVADESVDQAREPRVCDLGGEELEEAVELVGIALQRGRQRLRVGVLGRLERPYLHLQPVAEALDSPEHPDCVALVEAAVEELDIAPDARLDATARIGELEGEEGSARASATTLLARDREHALDHPVLLELGDRGHGPESKNSLRKEQATPRCGAERGDAASLGPTPGSAPHFLGSPEKVAPIFREIWALPGPSLAPPSIRLASGGPPGGSSRTRAVGTLAAMADVQPFRAVRYSGAAGPLADLVAPPYDTVSREERSRLFSRSPYNVARLTLPDSAEEAASLYRTWLGEGILVREPEPGAWLVAEEFVGPDGLARERHGVIVSLAVQPYSDGAVIPHERTHPRIKEDRLRLLQATRVQLEPIFLLSDTSLELPVPERVPDLRANGAQLWRLPEPDPRVLRADLELLIADGHHRYESAVEFASTAGPAAARMMALLVSTEDPGLQVFPTHRVFRGRPDLAELREGETCAGLDEALAKLADEPHSYAAGVAYRRGRVELVRGEDAELDVELVDRHGLEGIDYTPVAAEAVAAVDRGEADVAFLVRAPRIGDVFASARRGERMPPKSTYFFPKPLSGLLFHPLDS